MIGDPNIEYDTPLYDEEGNLIEVIEEDEIFPDDPLPFPELPDEAYEGEMNDLAEQQGEEESNIDPVEEIISSAGEVYSAARNKLVELYTQILTTGEITAEQNVELEQTLFEYSSSYNEIKDKVVEQEQGNNDGVEIEQEPEPIVTDELIEEIIDRLNNGGRNDLLFVDEDGRVLVNGEQVPLLKLIRLDVEQLYADYAQIKVLVADKADIKELNAIKATIGEMDVDIGRIDTLLGGNLTMENMASLILTSQKVTVEDAFIKNAMIDSVSAAKVNTGTLNTNLVNIQSDDGSLLLNGTLQQFKDANGKVRIQMGKDAQGNFTFGLFDETGIGTLIDSTGIKEKAIGDGLIVNKMIGENANISGSKLDINSVVTEVNNGANTIKGTKIKLDEQNQTLDVAFNSMTTTVTEQGKAVGSHTTSINIMQGQIGTLISDTEIIEEGNKVTVKDAYNKLTLKVNEFGVSLKGTQSEFDNMVIGTRNLIANSAPSSLTGYSLNTATNWSYALVDCADATRGKAIRCTNINKASGGVYIFPIKKDGLINGATYTLSVMVRASNNNIRMTIRQEQMVDSTMINMSTDWTLITFTSKVDTSKTSKGIIFYVDMNTINPGDWFELHSAMFEKATKPSNYMEAPEDVEGQLTSLGTRVKNAETKLTLDGLTTIIGSTYITPTQLNNKGYATTSDVTQSVESWVAKFNQSGGYNILYNGNFKADFRQWSNSGSNTIVKDVSCPTNPTAVKLVGVTGASKAVYQSIGSMEEPLNIDKTLVISMWGYLTSSGTDGTTNPYHGFAFSIIYTDGTKTYPGGNFAQKGYDKWNRHTATITPTTGKKIARIEFQVLLRDSTKTMYATDIILSIGSTEVPYAGNPNESYDGITTIDRDGIEVTATNAGTKTLMSADGFFLKQLDGTNLFKVDKNGLEMTGKVTSTSGKIADFEITKNTLFGGNLGLAGPGATLNDIAIWAGNADPVRAPLAIYHDGELMSRNYSNGYFTSIAQGNIKISTASAVITGNSTGLTIKKFDNKRYLEIAPDLIQMWTNDPTYKQILNITEIPSRYSFTNKVDNSIGVDGSMYLANGLAVNGNVIANGSFHATDSMSAPTHLIPSQANTALNFSIGGFGGSSIYGDTQGVAYLGNCIIVYGNYKFTNVTANSSMSTTITFRLPFNSAPFISVTVNTSTPHTSYAGAVKVSATQFDLTFHRTSATDTTVFWCAIGQRA